jgi:hypothetical protein
LDPSLREKIEPLMGEQKSAPTKRQ